MKRFWKEVAVAAQDDGTHVVTLDGRPVRTPGRLLLALPTPALAAAVAGEWRAVEDEVAPRAMPLTGLSNAAIERIAPARDAFAAGLARYAENDLLCYRAAEPEPLVERQRAAWDPLLGWARQRFDVAFETATGIVHVPQPAATLARLHEAVATRDAFTLAALNPVVTITGSLVIGLALDEGAATPDDAWAASRVDEDWQIEMWGSDPLAEAATAAHRAEFDAGVRLLELSRAQS